MKIYPIVPVVFCTISLEGAIVKVISRKSNQHLTTRRIERDIAAIQRSRELAELLDAAYKLMQKTQLAEEKARKEKQQEEELEKKRQEERKKAEELALEAQRKEHIAKRMKQIKELYDLDVAWGKYIRSEFYEIQRATDYPLQERTKRREALLQKLTEVNSSFSEEIAALQTDPEYLRGTNTMCSLYRFQVDNLLKFSYLKFYKRKLDGLLVKLKPSLNTVSTPV